ncbi:MAG: phosphatase PAP2 family protein [Paludibacteraceae bacterium]|nr:phosphatase PAP2 family protein [Paludibacteraceae bacterium]
MANPSANPRRTAVSLRLPNLFLGMSIGFLIALGIALLLTDKMQTHLWLNAHHTPVADRLLLAYTHVGEWVPYVIALLLLFYKAGWSAFLTADLALSGLLAQALKYLFATDRPVRFFALHMPEVQLPAVEGLRLSEFYSFPSGHSVSFFVLFLTLSWIFTHDRLRGRGILQVLFFCMALTGCYSRIYLSMHFAEDIWGGALFGLLFSLMFALCVPKIEESAFWNWNLLALRGRRQDQNHEGLAAR